MHVKQRYRDSLDKLRDFYQLHGRLPSLGETAALLGYSSRSSAVFLVNKLIGLGFLVKDERGKLSPAPRFHRKVRILGSVAAGFPTPEEEELRNTVSLEDFLIERPTSTFMLQVKGDSMIRAGIMPGDYVLVEKGRQPRPGDIVIAQVDGEWTMKYYRVRDSKVYLEAANPRYSDIYPQTELYIGGIVVSSCRKYD